MNSKLTLVDKDYSPDTEGDAERFGNGGNGGSGMDRRMGAIENRLTAVEVRMQYLATKEDLEKVKNSILKTIWTAVSVIVSIAVAILGVIVSIAVAITH